MQNLVRADAQRRARRFGHAVERRKLGERKVEQPLVAQDAVHERGRVAHGRLLELPVAREDAGKRRPAVLAVQAAVEQHVVRDAARE
eukprot:3656960-Prymnesium_polylepis.1